MARASTPVQQTDKLPGNARNRHSSAPGPETGIDASASECSGLRTSKLSTRRSAPLAAMFGHNQDRVQHLQVRQADVAALHRQVRRKPLVLSIRKFHPGTIAQRCLLVLTCRSVVILVHHANSSSFWCPFIRA